MSDPIYEAQAYEIAKMARSISALESENEKLREKYYEYESKMDGLVCKLTGGLLSKSATLSNDALYSVVEEQMTDELVDENFKLESENTKLRESVRNLLTCVKHEECEESCPNYEPMYTDYGYEKNGSTVVESEYLGCCTVGLENCNSMLFDTNEYLCELGIEVGP